MGRQKQQQQQQQHPNERNEEISRKRINEIEASNLRDIEFKVIVIRMLKELSETRRNLVGTTSAWKKYIETLNNNKSEMKNAISEMKNTLE